jgi:hypothetical protein
MGSPLFLEHKRIGWALTLLILSLLTAEEIRFGRILGLARFPCESLGGKFASAQDRCVTRACYWFNDCGYWAAPSRWRDRVTPGDPISNVVFWLGEPNSRRGDTYFWAYGKPGARLFSTTFHNGRFVEWQNDVAVPELKGE